MVNEDVVSGCAADESIAFFVIEPLYCTLFFHFSSVIAAPAIAGILSDHLHVCIGAVPGIQAGNTKPTQESAVVISKEAEANT
jgi:hypothetical protein